MWREHFINADPAAIMQRLYQLKAEQDGEKVTMIVHAQKRDAADMKKSLREQTVPLAVGSVGDIYEISYTR